MIDYSNAFVFSTCLLEVVFRNGIIIISRTNFTLISYFVLYIISRRIYYNLEAVNYFCHIYEHIFERCHKLKARGQHGLNIKIVIITIIVC